MLRSLLVSLLGCLLLVACGGRSSSQVVHETAVDNAPDDVRSAIEGVVTAALTGDEDAFAQYLASSCDKGGKPLAALAALRNLLPEGQIEVQLPTVQVQSRDADHVTVTALSGLRILVDGKELPESTAVAIVGPNLDLVREGASWRLESCDLGR